MAYGVPCTSLDTKDLFDIHIVRNHITRGQTREQHTGVEAKIRSSIKEPERWHHTEPLMHCKNRRKSAMGGEGEKGTSKKKQNQDEP